MNPYCNSLACLQHVPGRWWTSRPAVQVLRETYPALQQLPGFEPDAVWLWPSITQRSYQTAEVLGSLLGLGRSRIVPEYTFLDARGLGALEGHRRGMIPTKYNNYTCLLLSLVYTMKRMSPRSWTAIACASGIAD